MTDTTQPWDDLEISDDAAVKALARLDAAWQDLLATLDGIPEDRLEVPGVTGDWTIRDLLGHIAFWDRFSLERGRSALEGLPFQTVPWEEMNERDIADRAGKSAADNRRDMEAAHAEMLAFVASSPQDADTLIPLLARMGVDTDQHYDEHAAEIRAWREREGI